MPRTLKLLLIENVDNTGIVGDVVTVRKGFARNFLLPRNLATLPSEEKVKELGAKRIEAQKQLAELRKHREALVAKLTGFSLTMIRSCNDQGILYGAVVQQDICDELAKVGFPGIKQREVRLGQVIKRVDHYDVHVKFDTDLDAVVKLHIQPDRKLEMEKLDQDDRAAKAKAEAAAPAEGGEAAADGAGKAEGAAPKADKPRGDRKPHAKPGEGGGADRGGERPAPGARRDREDRPRRGDVIAKFEAASLEVTKGWGKAAATPAAPGAAPTVGGDGAKPAKGEKAAKGAKGEKAEKGEGKGKKGK